MPGAVVVHSRPDALCVPRISKPFEPFMIRVEKTGA